MRRNTDPNFLFSLPPFIEWDKGPPRIVIAPSGGDDTKQMQAATDRLAAVGGGVIRLTVGDFSLAGGLGTIVRPENLFLERPK